jgi:hypothetical protein
MFVGVGGFLTMISVPVTACVAWAVGDAGHFVGYFVLKHRFPNRNFGRTLLWC